MKLQEFAYELPEHLIAQYPLEDRDQARLLIIDRSNKSIRHDSFDNIGQYLPQDSVIVINNSKVIPARLLGKRSNGGKAEVFLLKRLGDGYSYEAMLRPLKRIKEGQELSFGEGVSCTLVDRERRIVKFNRKDVYEQLLKIGHIPLPPYIKREDNEIDHEFYQTVYARHKGSVAAPTAGLAFHQALDAEFKTGWS